MKEIIINGKKIGPSSPIFLVAEAGINHNGELSIAKQLVDLTVEAKVDAIKFQTYITENVYVGSTPKVEYQKESAEDQESLEEMVKKYEFSFEDFKQLKEYCEKKGIIILSTPYDEESVKWLEKLQISAYKISSGDLNNFPLLKLISEKGKPILLSTGMATIAEIKESVNFLTSNEVKDLVIFQCTTNYPTPYNELNLNVIDTFHFEFPDFIIGFSDHSLGILASIGAAAKGVKIIEKHITLDKEMEGPDHKSSLDPMELKEWVRKIREIEKSLGSYEKLPSKTEIETSKIVKRSVVSRRELNEGEIIQIEDIMVKRPASGIPANEFYNIIGKKIKKTKQKDQIIHWDDIE